MTVSDESVVSVLTGGVMHTLNNAHPRRASGRVAPRTLLLAGPLALALLAPRAGAQGGSAASPEMARLAQVMVGEWRTTEVVQNGAPVPVGAGRGGTVHVRLAGGGSLIVSDGHTNGKVGGDLYWHLVIWWDPPAKVYRLFTCFKTVDESRCEVRGTAHWSGTTFVNDYDEVIDGKRTKVQDIWSDITPTSNTLTEAHDAGNGVMKPYVVSHSTRS